LDHTPVHQNKAKTLNLASGNLTTLTYQEKPRPRVAMLDDHFPVFGQIKSPISLHLSYL
jgi:hypothetical protein